MDKLVTEQFRRLMSFDTSPKATGENVVGLIITYNDPRVCCFTSGSEDGKCIIVPGSETRLGPVGKVGIPYLVRVKGLDKKYIIKKTPKVDVYNKFSDKPPADGLIKNLSKYRRRRGGSKAIDRCITPDNIEEYGYVQLDEFTNETLCSYLIAREFDRGANVEMGSNGQILSRKRTMTENGHDFFTRHYIGTICKRTGINLMDWARLGSLNHLVRVNGGDQYREEVTADGKERYNVIIIKPSVVCVIIRQTMAALHFLQNRLSFVSGDFKSGNVLITDEDVDGDYLGMSVAGNIKVKLADFGKSSLTIPVNDGEDSIRIFNTNTISRTFGGLANFDIDIRTDQNGENWYKVPGTFNTETYYYLRHTGIPFYRSFDWYVFIFTLLSRPEYYYPILGNEDMSDRIWKKLWSSLEDEKKIYDRITKNMLSRKDIGINDAIGPLKGVYLRCGALESTMQNFGATVNIDVPSPSAPSMQEQVPMREQPMRHPPARGRMQQEPLLEQPPARGRMQQSPTREQPMKQPPARGRMQQSPTRRQAQPRQRRREWDENQNSIDL